MKVIHLSTKFYDEYGSYPEILKKHTRPYLCLLVEFDGIVFAVPFRHHIKHSFCFHTIGEAGLDFSKAIPIIDESFISDEDVRIETAEWRIINSSEEKIKYQFRQYIKQILRAFKRPDKEHSKFLLKYSSLQYFADVLICNITNTK